MHEMARSVDPLTTAKLTLVLQFNFPDKGYTFCLRIIKGTCLLEESRASVFDLCVTTDTGTWVKVFRREISIKKAIMERKISLEGDKSLFMRLEKYFPSPESQL
jgi:putative sterol carrier protein